MEYFVVFGCFCCSSQAREKVPCCCCCSIVCEAMLAAGPGRKFSVPLAIADATRLVALDLACRRAMQIYCGSAATRCSTPLSRDTAPARGKRHVLVGHLQLHAWPCSLPLRG